VLSVDDAQWGDESSLTALGFLARRLADLPVLLAVATRPRAPASSPALAELLADPEAVVLRPGAFSLQAVEALVSSAADRDADLTFAGACHAVTGGNPLLLKELLREVRAEGIAPTASEAPRVEQLGPRGVSMVVLLRLGRLSAGAVALARSVAVLGDHAEVADAAALAGMPEPDARAVAAALVDAEVLEDASRCASSTPSSAPRSTRTCRPSIAGGCTPRRPATCTSAARRPRRSPRRSWPPGGSGRPGPSRRSGRGPPGAGPR
jgi:hypothetical protein